MYVQRLKVTSTVWLNCTTLLTPLGAPPPRSTSLRTRDGRSNCGDIYLVSFCFGLRASSPAMKFSRPNPEFKEKLSKMLGYELTPDSHALEYIGLGYSWNRVNYDDPMMELMKVQWRDTIEAWILVQQRSGKSAVPSRTVGMGRVTRSLSAPDAKVEPQLTHRKRKLHRLQTRQPIETVRLMLGH
jgi:hypothetical protein